GKTVGFVAQPLHEVEYRIVGRQAKGRFSRHEKALAPGIAVGPLRDPGNSETVKAEPGEHLLRRGQLPGTAIDQQKVWPGRCIAALALDIIFVFDGPGSRLCNIVPSLIRRGTW